MIKIYEIVDWPDPHKYMFSRPKSYYFKDKEIADKFAEFLDKSGNCYFQHNVVENILYDDFEIAKMDYELLLKYYKEKKYEN